MSDDMEKQEALTNQEKSVDSDKEKDEKAQSHGIFLEEGTSESEEIDATFQQIFQDLLDLKAPVASFIPKQPPSPGELFTNKVFLRTKKLTDISEKSLADQDITKAKNTRSNPFLRDEETSNSEEINATNLNQLTPVNVSTVSKGPSSDEAASKREELCARKRHIPQGKTDFKASVVGTIPKQIQLSFDGSANLNPQNQSGNVASAVPKQTEGKPVI